MTHRKVIDSIRVEFESIIEDKNSWGKNEVKAVLDKAIANHYISRADGKLEGTILRKRIVTKESFETPKTMNKRALSNLPCNRKKPKDK